MCTGRRIPKISLGIRGLSKNLGRDDGIEEPYWGPFLLFDILVFFGRLLSWASSESKPVWTEIKEYPNGMNREEKPLHHFAMAAKFQDLNKPLPSNMAEEKKKREKFTSMAFLCMIEEAPSIL